ncbi:MAG: hypothetical protein J6G98_00400 [Bacilli bacterium]|nr:hypothetical protein [Bacilli bacterium]
MTQKELLYVEDAIGHESSIIEIIKESINSMDDDTLINFLENDLKKHKELKLKLTNLLEEKANE